MAALRSSRVFYRGISKRGCGFQHLFSSSTRIPIDEEIPGMPELKPARDLAQPVRQETTLSSGVRVCTLETHEQVSCIGVFVNAGTMQEIGDNNGVASIIDKLAFCGTQRRTGKNLQMLIQELGGNVLTLLSRDMMIYQIEVLRDSIEEGMEIVADAVQHPDCSQQNLDLAKQMIQFQKEDQQYEAQILINEYLHEAAYGKGSPLGQPLMCPDHNLERINADMLHDYIQDHYTPNNIVVAATSVDHEAFCSFVDKKLTHLAPNKPKGATLDMTYKGGSALVEQKPMVREVSAAFVEAPPEFAHVGLAFEIDGWHSDDLIPVCVLHTLLGGGSAFSAGGPGKGMYSRLYKSILNQFYYAECALSTAVMYSDTGLFGVYGSAKPEHIGALIGNLAEQLDMLADHEPGDVELSRARNQLKSSMLMNLESRQIMCEDIGKQIHMFGEVKPLEEVCTGIDSVTAEDVSRVTRKMMGSPPSYAMYGSLSKARPVEYENIQNYFARFAK